MIIEIWIICMVSLPEYRNVCECPPTIISMSSTSLAIIWSFSMPLCPRPIIMLTPSSRSFFVSFFKDSTSSKNSTFPLLDMDWNNVNYRYVSVLYSDTWVYEPFFLSVLKNVYQKLLYFSRYTQKKNRLSVKHISF